MNLHALRIFYAVAKHGGVTRASEELLLSQPAVTAQLRNLEREVGLALLAPKGRGIRLTEAGSLLAEQAERLFALERDIEDRLAAYREGKRGKLRIAATSLPANLLLPSWIASYKLRHEEVEVVLSTRNTREAFAELLHYKADLAFVGGGGEAPEGVEREVLLEDEMWFAVPPSHPLAERTVSLEVMMREPFILREEGSSARDKLMALCRERGVPLPRAGLQVNGWTETIRAVAAGYGAIFVSALEVKEAIARGEVARVHVEHAALRNPIALCRRSGERLPPAAEQFAAWVRSRLSGGMTT